MYTVPFGVYVPFIQTPCTISQDENSYQYLNPKKQFRCPHIFATGTYILKSKNWFISVNCLKYLFHFWMTLLFDQSFSTLWIQAALIAEWLIVDVDQILGEASAFIIMSVSR